MSGALIAFGFLALFFGMGTEVQRPGHENITVECHDKFPSRCKPVTVIKETTFGIGEPMERDCQLVGDQNGKKFWIGKDCGR